MCWRCDWFTSFGGGELGCLEEIGIQKCGVDSGLGSPSLLEQRTVRPKMRRSDDQAMVPRARGFFEDCCFRDDQLHGEEGSQRH